MDNDTIPRPLLFQTSFVSHNWLQWEEYEARVLWRSMGLIIWSMGIHRFLFSYLMSSKHYPSLLLNFTLDSCNFTAQGKPVIHFSGLQFRRHFCYNISSHIYKIFYLLISSGVSLNLIILSWKNLQLSLYLSSYAYNESISSSIVMDSKFFVSSIITTICSNFESMDGNFWIV